MDARSAAFHLQSCEQSPSRAMFSRTVGSTSVVSTALPVRVATRFGPSIDVRNRGALKVASAATTTTAPRHLAVVRIWNGDCCREMSVTDARIFAAQLMAAASYAENQNASPDPSAADQM